MLAGQLKRKFSVNLFRWEIPMVNKKRPRPGFIDRYSFYCHNIKTVLFLARNPQEDTIYVIMSIPVLIR